MISRKTWGERWEIWRLDPSRYIRVGSAGTEAAARRWLARLAPRCPGRWSVLPSTVKPPLC
jgi:hypothetical protein